MKLTAESASCKHVGLREKMAKEVSPRSSLDHLLSPEETNPESKDLVDTGKARQMADDGGSDRGL